MIAIILRRLQIFSGDTKMIFGLRCFRPGLIIPCVRNGKKWSNFDEQRNKIWVRISTPNRQKSYDGVHIFFFTVEILCISGRNLARGCLHVAPLVVTGHLGSYINIGYIYWNGDFNDQITGVPCLRAKIYSSEGTSRYRPPGYRISGVLHQTNMRLYHHLGICQSSHRSSLLIRQDLSQWGDV